MSSHKSAEPPKVSPMNYHAIDALRNEIRLLTIHPLDDNATESDSADIVCSLENISLDLLPAYIAVSYCWGNDSDRRTIKINNYSFTITTNLYDALLVLRSKKIGPFWIDAVCINQKDKEEKGRQVQLMGSIYKRARVVVVWSGPEDEESTGLTSIIQQEGTTDQDVHETRAIGHAARHISNFAPMDNFLCRPYWTRVWIVQEIVLARSVVVYLGPHELHWENFATAVINIKSKINASHIHRASYENAENLISLRRLINGSADGDSFTEGTLITFLGALSRTSGAQATEPRDKIYGVLSLTSDGRDYVDTPTYQGTLQDVCQRIVLDVIATKRNLDLVALLGPGSYQPKEHPQWPSWCPQFHKLDRDIHHRQLTLLGAEDLHQNGSNFFHVRPCAAGATTALQTSHRDGALICQAMQIGQVSILGRSIGDKTSTQLSSGAEDVQQPQPPSPYKSDTEVWEAIYDTLTYGANMAIALPAKYDKSIKVAPAIPSIYRAEVLRLWRGRSAYNPKLDNETTSWIEGQRHFMLHGRTIQQWCKRTSWTNQGLWHRDHSAHFRRHIMEADVIDRMVVPDLTNVINTGLKFMLTSQRWFGWAPQLARTGDPIYLLQGCNFPVVLRSRDNGGLTLVGDAFIPNIMNGEALDRSASYTSIEIF